VTSPHLLGYLSTYAELAHLEKLENAIKESESVIKELVNVIYGGTKKDAKDHSGPEAPTALVSKKELLIDNNKIILKRAGIRGQI
jgi:hypothetical protein